MESAVVSRMALLAAVLLVGEVCAGVAHGGGGFRAEFIHRDSPRSPFHDPSLTVHDRVLAAARRSMARAAALALSYGGGDVVSQVVSGSSEYLMTINLGTPPVRMLAIVDTGSDLLWVNCRPNATAAATAAAARPSAGDPVLFDPSVSASYAPSFCDSTACQALGGAASCGANSSCQYRYSYQDGSQTSGVLSTETFTFDDGVTSGRQVRVRASFGCSTVNTGSFDGDGLVGLGAGIDSLAMQLTGDTSLNMMFSYCLVPYSLNLASVFNFGSRANVTEPGAATTAMIASKMDSFYTISLEAVNVAGQPVAAHQTPIIVDSGTTLTFLDKALLDPLVAELSKRITLPPAQSPEKIFTLCYNVSGGAGTEASIPDVTLELGGAAAVTLRPENTFVRVSEGTVCLALVAVSDQVPFSILGNLAQQNFHIGYDLGDRTVTFAAANCASPSPAARHS